MGMAEDEWWEEVVVIGRENGRLIQGSNLNLYLICAVQVQVHQHHLVLLQLASNEQLLLQPIHLRHSQRESLEIDVFCIVWLQPVHLLHSQRKSLRYMSLPLYGYTLFIYGILNVSL